MLNKQHSIGQLERRGVKEPKLMIGHLRTHVRGMIGPPEKIFGKDGLFYQWQHPSRRPRVRLTIIFPRYTFGLCNEMTVTWYN